MEVTEENRDASQEAKAQAMEAISDGKLFDISILVDIEHLKNPSCPINFLNASGKLDEAVEHLTKAITLNPTSAIMYGTRGNSLINL